MVALREYTDRRIQYVFAIDPGTGSTSPCGIALYDTKEQKVIWTHSIYPMNNKLSKMNPRHRIKLIVEQILHYFDHTLDMYGIDNVAVAIESFVMRGKGGVTLAEFKGAILTRLPLEMRVDEIQNTRMKKIAGDTGKATKEDIGINLIKLIPKSKDMIEALIFKAKWDEIDAIGLAYSANFS